jgi:hypothetical protein
MRNAITLPGSGCASMAAFTRSRSRKRCSMSSRHFGLRASTRLKTSASSTTASVVTAAFTVAVRGESDRSAISPT